MGSLTKALKKTGKDLALTAFVGSAGGTAGISTAAQTVKRGKTDVALKSLVQPFRKPGASFLSPGQASLSQTGTTLGGRSGRFLASAADPGDVFKFQASGEEQKSFEEKQVQLAKEKEESEKLSLQRKTARRTGQGLSTILTGGRGLTTSGGTVRSLLRAA